MEQRLFEIEQKIKELEQNLNTLLNSYQEMYSFFDDFEKELKKIEGLNDNFQKIIKLLNQFNNV
jgi:predicted ribosome quality control (RQC) complex YloA/Tae2 family protein